MKHNTFQNFKSGKKIIKRYGNRKLYDTEQSSYVVLNDIAKMIRNKEEVQVIDNETKDDITLSTLTQIIFGAEKRSRVSAPLDVLKSIIREGDGSFSSFLSKMGLFKSSGSSEKRTASRPSGYKTAGVEGRRSREESRQSVGQKIANVATSYQASSLREKEEQIPRLPGSRLNR